MKEVVSSERNAPIIPEEKTEQDISKNELSSSKPNPSSVEQSKIQVTSNNQQQANKTSTSMKSDVINSNIDRKENMLQKQSFLDKNVNSADSMLIRTNEQTAEDESNSRKLSVDILNSIQSGPNLQSKDSTSRNFGERMVALQKAGKLISREEKEKMDQTSNCKSSQTEKESPPKVSWKSEYSVSNEASATAGSMFGLNPSLRKTTVNQHHGTDFSLAGGIRNPSSNQPHRSPSSNLPPSGTLKSISTPKQSIGTDSGAQKTFVTREQVEPVNKSSLRTVTTSKTGTKFQAAPKSVNSTPNTQTNVNKKVSSDDVQICSCVERTNLNGSHKCSHSGPNAIHLDMDRVMQFLAESEK